MVASYFGLGKSSTYVAALNDCKKPRSFWAILVSLFRTNAVQIMEVQVPSTVEVTASLLSMRVKIFGFDF